MHVSIWALAIPWPRRPASSSAENAMDALHMFSSSERAAEDDKATVQNIAMAAAATTSPLATIPPFFLSREERPRRLWIFLQTKSEFLEVVSGRI